MSILSRLGLLKRESSPRDLTRHPKLIGTIRRFNEEGRCPQCHQRYFFRVYDGDPEIIRKCCNPKCEIFYD
jgi:hypothetical protein